MHDKTYWNKKYQQQYNPQIYPKRKDERKSPKNKQHSTQNSRNSRKRNMFRLCVCNHVFKVHKMTESCKHNQSSKYNTSNNNDGFHNHKYSLTNNITIISKQNTTQNRKLGYTTIMNTSFVFFGTPEFSTIILDELKQQGYLPSLIITAPDKPVGRKQVLTSPAVKIWADENNIECWQPEHPRDIVEKLQQRQDDLYIVAAYGYILSSTILDIPKHGTLNVHTSLLPLHRGACPIESAILAGDEITGSTIMLMDEKLDHGPILAQEAFPLDPNTDRIQLFEKLAHHGGLLLAQTLAPWISGTIKTQEQEHNKATFCRKIQKSDGDITNNDDNTRYRKYLAYFGWPGVFYFDERGKRIKITKARFEAGKFIIEKIIPEGKSEMDFVE